MAGGGPCRAQNMPYREGLGMESLFRGCLEGISRGRERKRERQKDREREKEEREKKGRGRET